MECTSSGYRSRTLPRGGAGPQPRTESSRCTSAQYSYISGPPAEAIVVAPRGEEAVASLAGVRVRGRTLILTGYPGSRLQRILTEAPYIVVASPLNPRLYVRVFEEPTAPSPLINCSTLPGRLCPAWAYSYVEAVVTARRRVVADGEVYVRAKLLPLRVCTRSWPPRWPRRDELFTLEALVAASRTRYWSTRRKCSEACKWLTRAKNVVELGWELLSRYSRSLLDDLLRVIERVEGVAALHGCSC